MVARPRPDNGGATIRLTDIIDQTRERNLRTPLLIRFQDILRHRVQTINAAFAKAISEYEYRGSYRGVFPIKVNQLREVVEEILIAGESHQTGLEVGSKPELFAALALHEQLGSLIICNGYKDSEFIRLALLSSKLGMQTIIVMESVRELKLILEVSRELGIPPTLGVRVKLVNMVSGNWAATSGDRSSFGLSIARVVEVVEILREENLLDCLVLQPSHLGSQVPNMIEIR